MAGFKGNAHTELVGYSEKALICIGANRCRKQGDKSKRKKLLGVCLCVYVCVHVLIGVPVCKRLKGAHVNNKRAALAMRACVVNFLRASKDYALICTVTQSISFSD